MNIPNYYKCSSCQEKFQVPVLSAFYYIGSAVLGNNVNEIDLVPIPVRPAWCKDCDALCIAEDIASLRTFEDAYGAVRCGREIEYPLYSGIAPEADVQEDVAKLLRWRMGRIHRARALCCGRSNFQFMDVAQPLIKHDGCEYGFIEPWYLIGPYCGGSGVYLAANFSVHNSEGELIGRLTWRNREEASWKVESAKFEVPTQEQP